MRKSGLTPDLVLCSSARRAVQTWDGIRGGLPAGTSIEIEEGLYAADAERLLARLNQLPQSVGSVLLIGHNPAIEELALGLSGDGVSDALHRIGVKYPTGGLASLAFRGEWKALRRGAARLEDFVVPREL
jgi:phosphohistidine phosphatase